MIVLASSQSLFAQPGTVAFLVIFGMGVVCVFLFRSMNKHLRKVSDAARAEAEAAEAAADDGPAVHDADATRATSEDWGAGS